MDEQTRTLKMKGDSFERLRIEGRALAQLLEGFEGGLGGSLIDQAVEAVTGPLTASLYGFHLGLDEDGFHHRLSSERLKDGSQPFVVFLSRGRTRFGVFNLRDLLALARLGSIALLDDLFEVDDESLAVAAANGSRTWTEVQSKYLDRALRPSPSDIPDPEVAPKGLNAQVWSRAARVAKRWGFTRRDVLGDPRGCVDRPGMGPKLLEYLVRWAETGLRSDLLEELRGRTSEE